MGGTSQEPYSVYPYVLRPEKVGRGVAPLRAWGFNFISGLSPSRAVRSNTGMPIPADSLSTINSCLFDTSPMVTKHFN